ncbi:MAG TPA: hypothetical protein DCE78_03365 [Bacteroidetes bacterium]|nr:hypothetical protein [Bacteroidota bacterium]
MTVLHVGVADESLFSGSGFHWYVEWQRRIRMVYVWAALIWFGGQGWAAGFCKLGSGKNIINVICLK